MLEQIIEFDHALFYLINGQWHNALFDGLLPILRNKYLWMPLYLFLLIFIFLNFPKNGWKYVLVIVLTVVLADQISASLIKPLVDRCRPCRLEPFNEQVRILVHCGSGRSFVSSHATNHFALAICWSVLFNRYFRWVLPVCLFWAFAISYSQVYVGIHFPIDVICGGILGICIGLFTGWLGRFLEKNPFIINHTTPNKH